MERVVKIKDIQKRITAKEKLLKKYNGLAKEIIEQDLKDLDSLLVRLRNGERIVVN
jgi:hypothetical protein